MYLLCITNIILKIEEEKYVFVGTHKSNEDSNILLDKNEKQNKMESMY